MDAVAPPLLDAAYLDRQTAGDVALAHELLTLFAAQLEAVPADAGAADLHRLRGASLAIGATALAEAADTLENALRDAQPDVAETRDRFSRLVDATYAAVAQAIGQR